MTYFQIKFDDGDSVECHPASEIKCWFTFDMGKTWVVQFKGGGKVNNVIELRIVDTTRDYPLRGIQE